MDGCGRIARKPSDDPSIAAVSLHRSEPLLRPSRPGELPSRPGEFHPESLTDPDLILSHHPARATARRLPPSIEYRVPPVAGCPDLKGDDLPPSLHGHYPASALLRGS